MISTLERNSEEEWKENEMATLVENFENSGYTKEELLQIKNKAINHMNNVNTRSERETITFPLHFFEELKDFKKILRLETRHSNLNREYRDCCSNQEAPVNWQHSCQEQTNMYPGNRTVEPAVQRNKLFTVPAS